MNATNSDFIFKDDILRKFQNVYQNSNIAVSTKFITDTVSK